VIGRTGRNTGMVNLWIKRAPIILANSIMTKSMALGGVSISAVKWLKEIGAQECWKAMLDIPSLMELGMKEISFKT